MQTPATAEWRHCDDEQAGEVTVWSPAVTSAVQGQSWMMWSGCYGEATPPAPALLSPPTTRCPSPRSPAWRPGPCLRAPLQVQLLSGWGFRTIVFNALKVFYNISTFKRSTCFFLFLLLEYNGSVWSGGVSSSYGYHTNPNNLSTTSTLYQSGQCLTAEVKVVSL